MEAPVASLAGGVPSLPVMVGTSGPEASGNPGGSAGPVVGSCGCAGSSGCGSGSVGSVGWLGGAVRLTAVTLPVSVSVRAEAASRVRSEGVYGKSTWLARFSHG